MQINPIGYIYTDFKEKFGIPRQSGRVSKLTGKIVFTDEYKNSEALRGIEEFSHLWIIFGFSENENKRKVVTVRPPRLGGNKRIGVFASRAPYRPNSLGLSVVKLEKIENEAGNGEVLIVSGVDMLDGTPIYDIKPYLPYADCICGATGSYGEENKDYSVKVVFPEELINKFPSDKREALIECLKEDPRPSYHNDSRTYVMNYAGFDIQFSVQENILTVTNVKNDKKR